VSDWSEAMVVRSFTTSQAETAFFTAYDRVLAGWPVQTESLDVVSEFGSTHAQVCGPDDAPPLILLHGGGATSTVWFANVADLAQSHRVYAIDTIGDAGRSRATGRPITNRHDLMTWLDGVLDGLGLLGAAIVGHSYGGWIGLSYALHAPQRVRALALLDPTQCFAGLRTGYLLRAVPVLVHPTVRSMRRLLSWESAGADLDPAWLELISLGTASFPRSKLVVGPRPEPELLPACTVPTLILLAGRSRAHDVEVVSRSARQLMPRAVITTLPGVSHHEIPMRRAPEVNRQLLSFIG
jgi:pimeloyl-ACP methyl ester carboxylesterase